MTGRRVVCLVGLLILTSIATASGVNAQAGSINVYGDIGLTQCDIVESTPGLLTLYISHEWAQGVIGAQFALDMYGTTWMYLSQASPYWMLGDVISGATVCYGACLNNPGVILEVTFFSSGTTPPCTIISIVPNPEAPALLALDCDMNLVSPTGGAAFVNGDGTCFCHAGPGTPATPAGDQAVTSFCGPVPVEKTTWGAIKSMYE